MQSGYGAVPTGSSVEDAVGQDDMQKKGSCLGKMARVSLVAMLIGGLVFFVANFTARQVSPDSFVPYRLEKHPFPPGHLWGDIPRPYPTGAWWLNLVLGNGDNPVAAYPYAYSSGLSGVKISYGAQRRIVTEKSVEDVFAQDIGFYAESPAKKHFVSKFDAVSVTKKYELHDGGTYEASFVKGCPYTTFTYNGVRPIITPLVFFDSINGETPNGLQGVGSQKASEFVISTSHGQTWVLFTSSPVTIYFTNLQLWLEEEFTGWFRVALAPHPSDADVLSKYHKAIPTGGDVEIDSSSEKDHMTMTYTWKVMSGKKEELLMLAAPHHMTVMELGAEVPVMSGKYRSMKGILTPIVGGSWLLSDSLPVISWDAPTPILNDTWREELRAQVKLDVNAVPPIVPDVYNFGKELARLGRIALISDQLNETSTRDKAVSIMEDALIPWLTGSNTDYLVYDESWGGIVTSNGLDDSHEDFGNGWYNDHVFQFGYLIYSAAVICKFSPSTAAEYKDELRFLVADVANSDPKSKYFPVARNKDLWDWHSWASGLFESANGKSMESSSEAVNGFYSVYLFGLAVGDAGLAQWGRVLTQMEIRAAQTYWQMPKESEVYDAAFKANRMAGVVGATDVVAQTWFGSNLEYVHCINMMPFTPITEQLLRPAYVAGEYPVLHTTIEGDKDITEEWKGFLFMDKAIIEPQQAWDDFAGLHTIDSGGSRSNAMYWIATRPPHGLNESNPFEAEEKLTYALCDDNSGCAVLGLQGLCCPTEEGLMLGCCPMQKEVDASPMADIATNSTAATTSSSGAD